MNLTYIHLALSHVPVIGALLGSLLLLVGILKKSDDIKQASLLLFVLSAVIAIPVYVGGESAEETVEHLPGVLEALIEDHEFYAKITLGLIEVLGVASLAMGWLFFKTKQFPQWTIVTLMILSVFTGGAMAQTAHLGGVIRHSEIRGSSLLTPKHKTREGKPSRERSQDNSENVSESLEKESHGDQDND